MSYLDVSTFLTVVRKTPLVAVDLVILDSLGSMLVGHRTNPPAKDYWFVPGGRVRKGESLDEAFSRIAFAELDTALARSDAWFLGVYEHFYEEDFAGEVDSGTHYVVLVHAVQQDPASLQLPMDQHDGYRWVTPEEGRMDLSIHANTRVYFDALR